MQRFQYKVVPAPKRGEKAKGAKTTEDRFAVALTQLMNALGAEGWEYLRADTLPCDERVGLTGSRTTYQNMLVFRRALAADAEPLAEAPPAPTVLPAAPATLRVVPAADAPTRSLGAAVSPLGVAPPVGGTKTERVGE